MLVGVESIPYVVKCQISSINRTPAAFHKAEYIRDLFFKADRLFHVPHALLRITNPAAQPFR